MCVCVTLCVRVWESACSVCVINTHTRARAHTHTHTHTHTGPLPLDEYVHAVHALRIQPPTRACVHTGIGDNMLLQPNSVPCERIWGHAKSEEAVTVTFLGRQYSTVAARARTAERGGVGRWSVCIDTTKVMGGPFEMRIASGGNLIVLRHVQVGLMASSCHNNARNAVNGPYSCGQFRYPAQWLNQALAWWSFDACARSSQGLAPQQVRLTGKCDPSGMIAEAWRFGPNQFLQVDRVAGLRTGRPPHTLAFWVIVRNVTDGDVPLATLGTLWQPSFGDTTLDHPTPTGGDIDHAAASHTLPGAVPSALDQDGTYAGAAGAGDGAVGGVRHQAHTIENRFVTLRASQRLCGATASLSSPLAAQSPQPALVLGVPSRDGAEFYHCSGLRLQLGVWYHVAWSYNSGVSGGGGGDSLGADHGGEISLVVNGEEKRRIAVSEALNIGSSYRQPDAGGRVSLYLGRDQAARRTNASWTLDELWLFPSALRCQRLRVLAT